MCIQFTDLVFIVSCFQEGRGNVALMGSVRGPVHRSEILTISIDSCGPWFAE